MRQQTRPRSVLVLIALMVSAALAVGCGGGHEGHDGSSSSSAGEADKAFVRLMIPHHESAVEMAEIAQKRGQHKEVKDLAGAIVTTQKAEIDQLKGIADSIGAASTDAEMSHDEHSMGAADSSDLEALDLSEDEAGMSMHMSFDELESAKPFDRAFIDEMVPHHEGAVRMAEAQLAKGENTDLHTLAQEIIDAQEKEIVEMNEWRTRWYGAPVAGSK
jgi:uncharacterized protein (DUF305 family)